MSQHEVTFLPHNRKIRVNDGETLLRAAMAAGVHVNASCGGEGVCGKCRVMIEDGIVSGGESERLSAEDLENGYRLACQAVVKSDLTVRIPVESAIDTAALSTQVAPRQTARIQQMDFEELKEEGLFVPPVEKSTWNCRHPTNRTTCRT